MRILVGCPTSEIKGYCLNEYLEGVKKLSYEDVHLVLVDNSKNDDYYDKLKRFGVSVIRGKYFESAKERVIHSRNLLRRYCLENNYDYFLSLEQDVVPPKDAIERLLKHNKEIVGGLYFYLGDDNKTLLPMVWVHHHGEYARRLMFHEVLNDELIEVITCGLGCVLIRKDALEKIRFRHVEGEEPWDDLWFCEDARDKGFKVYVDNGVRCKHYIKGMDWSNIKK